LTEFEPKEVKECRKIVEKKCWTVQEKVTEIVEESECKTVWENDCSEMKESQECKTIYEEVCDNSYEEKIATTTSQVDEYGAPLAPKCRQVPRENAKQSPLQCAKRCPRTFVLLSRSQ